MKDWDQTFYPADWRGHTVKWCILLYLAPWEEEGDICEEYTAEVLAELERDTAGRPYVDRCRLVAERIFAAGRWYSECRGAQVLLS